VVGRRDGFAAGIERFAFCIHCINWHVVAGETALQLSIYYECPLELVRLLVDRYGAEVNTADASKTTPLMVAAYRANMEVTDDN
jgi:ankyrin repeat protein